MRKSTPAHGHRGERRTLTTKQVRETEAEAVALVVCGTFLAHGLTGWGFGCGDFGRSRPAAIRPRGVHRAGHVGGSMTDAVEEDGRANDLVLQFGGAQGAKTDMFHSNTLRTPFRTPFRTPLKCRLSDSFYCGYTHSHIFQLFFS